MWILDESARVDYLPLWVQGPSVTVYIIVDWHVFSMYSVYTFGDLYTISQHPRELAPISTI